MPAVIDLFNDSSFPLQRKTADKDEQLKEVGQLSKEQFAFLMMLVEERQGVLAAAKAIKDQTDSMLKPATDDTKAAESKSESVEKSESPEGKAEEKTTEDNKSMVSAEAEEKKADVIQEKGDSEVKSSEVSEAESKGDLTTAAKEEKQVSTKGSKHKSVLPTFKKSETVSGVIV